MSSVLQPVKDPLHVITLAVLLVGIQAQGNSSEGTGTEGNGTAGNMTAGNGTAAGNTTVFPCKYSWRLDWNRTISPHLHCQDPSKVHCVDGECYAGIISIFGYISVNIGLCNFSRVRGSLSAQLWRMSF